MSHKAMNWALEQRQLKPAPWRVLVMLADRHNKDTLRVDPEQKLLAYDCSMSRSTLNRQLEELEGAGLIVRVQRINPKTQKQMPTFYILGLDFDAPPHVENAVSDYRTRIAEVQNGNIEAGRVSDPDTGAVSQKTQKPCPKKRDSRVSNSDTNLVKEPIREPSASGDAPTPLDDSPSEIFDLASDYLKAHPRPIDEPRTREAFLDAVHSDINPNDLIHAAEAYATEQRGKDIQYILGSVKFITTGRWRQYLGKSSETQRSATLKERAEFWANSIRDGKHIPHGHIVGDLRMAIIRFGHFTEEELKERNFL